jgi:UDP-glucose 4-epimerase
MLRHLAPQARKPSRVVVIGAGGFVGAAVVRRLRALDVPLVALTRHDVDLLAPSAAERLKEILSPNDSVVAAAARAPCRNIDMMIENMTMVRAMTAAIGNASPAHVINISSDAVYADGPTPLTEDTPKAPSSMHGAMHLAREIAFESELSAPLAMLRPTLLYGVEDPHNGYGPNRFRRCAAAGEDIALFGAGEERRDHVWVDDLAEITAHVLLQHSVGALNVATGEVRSFRALAELTIEASGRDSLLRETPRSGPMPHNGYRPFDISATRAAFPDFHYRLPEEMIRTLQRMTER